MQRGSNEWIYIPVTGELGWALGGTAEVSVDGGENWAPAGVVDAAVVKLPNGDPGETALVKILSGALGLPLPMGPLPFLVRVTYGGETPVMHAGRLPMGR